MNATGYRIALAAAMAAIGVATVASQDFRPEGPSWSLSGEASFSGTAAWATSPQYGSDSALELTLKARRPGIRAEFSGTADALTGPDGATAAFSLERAYLRWSPGPVVVTLGRQIVNWGNGLLWSPADLFAETRLVGLSPERVGADAIRVALPLGALGGVEAVAAPASDPSDGSYGGRLYGYALGSDFGLQAARDGAAAKTTVSAAVKTDLVLGLWAEIAYAVPDGAGPGDGSLETVAGADWSIGSWFFVAAEYRYNAGGARDAAEALEAAAEGEAYPARHYLYADASAKAGDFASLGIGSVVDLGDGIASVTLSAALDVEQDASLTIWAGYSSGSMTSLDGNDAASFGMRLALAF
ncbi:MAG: hypothetical protein CVV47_08650 [Spirochaetae bacterium HGW-Spirochaetae-3]|jgi:hypothetical protein|nr:MAG: hypothetical protein CVV47_08650 [Spirochaetae bacterium HGW-Spirochaetae-3]